MVMESVEMEGIKGEKGYLVVERKQNGEEKILYADQGACAVTGFALEELFGAKPDIAAKFVTEKVKFDNGHKLWILDKEGDKKQYKTRLEQINIALEDALKEAEAANRAKSNFLSNMSHDIRTPMNAIVGMASIGLAHIDEKSRVQDCLGKIQTASTHLMSLVNDVLDMSRIDSGRMTINEEIFSLADLVHDIAVIVRPQAAQKNQELQLVIGQVCEEMLVGDPLHLRQILVNIIGNAVKYTMEDGKIYAQFSQHYADDKKDVIWFDFLCEDNGIGMSSEFLKRIFVPFERVSNSTTSKIEGTGLGMAIVKKLIDQMGGEIVVQSEEGVGSKFFVKLPLFIASQNQKKQHLPVGQTVLVADEEGQEAAQAVKYLTDGGLVPVCMESGLDIVTWLTEAQYEGRMPCAMLLGRELSDMPVLELAAHVRQLAGKNFPIVLVSEQDWAQIEYRAVRAGVNAFVPCPLFQSRLLGTLSELLGGTQKDNETFSKQKTDFGRLHVLLVEDNEMNQEIAMELLSMIGVQVEAADNGVHAVETFEASEEGYFDVIFMDVQMPVMNGYEATKRIRMLSRKDAKSVWIVAMTANAFIEDVRQSREAGMNEHCSKPVDPERLQEILRKHLK